MRSEGGPPTGNANVDKAYDYAGDTYDYYLDEHGRDSFDGTGAAMIATVNSCLEGCPWHNARWLGNQTAFGALLVTDDIVGHEFTHGVTEYSANLYYYASSGALNESYSDIFGEMIDLTNGAGTDTPAVRWGFGEDIIPGFIGFRSLMDPTIWGDPGKLSDPQVHCDPSDDSGGVHTNSGIGNHAFALMVDGGTYNGYAISGIGLTKAGKIEYRALTQYLTSLSDFADNYNALLQSCTDLVGTAGITVADCAEIGKALDAVEMSGPWPCSARVCPAAPEPCNGTGKSLLLVKHDGDDESNDKLLWKWLKENTVLSFGDPRTRTGYSLCVYDQTSGSPTLVMSARVPAGGRCGDGDCWRMVPLSQPDPSVYGEGFAYRNAAATAQGIQKVLLKPGVGTARVLFKGRGANLNTPALPFTPPVTVQLLYDYSCQQAVYPGPAIIGTDTLFKAKSPSTTTSTSTSTSTTLPPCPVDAGDTVFDSCTGLEWEKKQTPVGSGVDPGDLHDVDNRYTWAGRCTLSGELCQPNLAAATTCATQTERAVGCTECAVGEGTCTVDPGYVDAITTIWDWVNQINAANFSGHNDWRVPRMFVGELETILSGWPTWTCPGVPTPCIDPIFGPTAAAGYWSASVSDLSAGVVDFGYGGIGYYGKDRDFHVRAVRTTP